MRCFRHACFTGTPSPASLCAAAIRVSLWFLGCIWAFHQYHPTRKRHFRSLCESRKLTEVLPQFQLIYYECTLATKRG